MSEPAPVATELRPAERVLLFAVIAARLCLSGSIYPRFGYAENALFAMLLVLFLQRRGLGLPRFLIYALGLYFAAGGLFVLGFLPLPEWMPFSIHPFDSLRWFGLDLGNLLLMLCVAAAGRKSSAALAGAIAAGVALSSLLAIRQRMGGFEATLAVDGISEYARQTLREARVFGLTFSPDLLAASIAGALPPTLALTVAGRRGGRPALFAAALAAIAVMLVALALTRSLGGWLATGVALLTLVATAPGLGRWRARIFGATLILSLIGASAIVVARGGHLFNLDNRENPAALRLDNWGTALRVAGEFPLTGAGGGQYGLAMFPHRSPTGNEARHVHNFLLETLAETGPLGLAGLLLIIFWFVRVGVSRPREGGEDQIFVAALFASGCGIIAHSLIDFSWQTVEVAAVFWIALGALVAADQPPAPPPRRLPVSVVLGFAALVFLGMAWVSGLRERAITLAREGEDRPALAAAAKALRFSPGDDELLSLSSSLLARTEGPKARPEAVRLLRRAVEINPRYPFHYRDLALALTDPAERVRLLQRAVALYPYSPNLNTWLGRFLLNQKREREAKEALRQAAASPKEGGEAMLMLAALAERRGDFLEAGIWYQRAAEARPVSKHRIEAGRKFRERRAQSAPALPVPGVTP